MPISKVLCDKCLKEIDYNDSYDYFDEFLCKKCYINNIMEDKIMRLYIVIDKESNYVNERKALEKEIVTLKREIKEINNE